MVHERLTEITPRLAVHEVAAIVARRPRTTPAAFVLVATAAAIPAVVKRSERLQNFVRLPNLVERRFANVAQFHIQISARLNFAARADYAVAQARQATASESRFYAELVGDS